MVPPVQRLFVALWPDEALRTSLAAFVLPRLAPVRGRAVPAGNLHVTLAFLGNVPVDALPSLRGALAGLSWPQVELTFDRLAWWRRAGLLCLEPSAVPEPFLTAVGQLHDALRATDFPVERRPFRTHVTLMRNVDPAPGFEGLQVLPPFTWPVRSPVLVASTPRPGGSEYRVVAGKGGQEV